MTLVQCGTVSQKTGLKTELWRNVIPKTENALFEKWKTTFSKNEQARATMDTRMAENALNINCNELIS